MTAIAFVSCDFIEVFSKAREFDMRFKFLWHTRYIVDDGADRVTCA